MKPTVGDARPQVVVAPWTESPYLALLAAHLREAGFDVAGVVQFRGRRLLRAARRGSVFHLHWLEYLYRADRPGPLGIVRAWLLACRFLALLVIVRSLGARIVWTVHNRRPHESRHRTLDDVAHFLVAHLAHVLLVHSAFAREAAVTAYRVTPEKILIAPHGNFIGLYPRPAASREEIRERLGLPVDAVVLLAFGQVRAYKRLDRLIEQFKTTTSANLRLVVAGSPRPPELADDLTRRSKDDPRILLMLSHVPDQQVAELHAASDAAVLAYDEVFTSGALMLALSLGLPVIVPGRGSARETVLPDALLEFGEDLAAVLDTTGEFVRKDTPAPAAIESARLATWNAAVAVHDRAYRR